jgi:phosphoribosylamine--glycine ligase
MRILGIGEFADLGAIYLRLVKEGHEVKVFSSIPGCRDILAGLVPRVPAWRAELDWIRAAGSDGLIIVETASLGATQNRLRRAGFNVIGGSAFGDRLENDRAFGQAMLREVGLPTAPVHDFDSFEDAITFVRQRPRRYVFKANGSAMGLATYVGQTNDGLDIIAQLVRHRNNWRRSKAPRFILMEHVAGVEVGVGAFFNGVEFLEPACIDWEHKRFFPGDLGEMTGEMGTVVSYRGATLLMDKTLRKLTPRLREDGYCGYINLNTIVNENGIWPLEFTARFGYPGTIILSALHKDRWGTLFKGLIDRTVSSVATREGFSVGVVLTVPPFPYRTNYQKLSKGMPVLIRGTLSPADVESFHYWEVAQTENGLVTAGILGQVMVTTGCGPDIDIACSEAYRRAARVVVPNMRYREDIGRKLRTQDFDFLTKVGLFAATDFIR